MSVTRAIILGESDRQSYNIIGCHYLRTFAAAGISAAEQPLPVGSRARRRAVRELAGQAVFHNTIGPLFAPLPGVVNVALPLHEWSRYPPGWVMKLNRFDAVWTATRFVKRVLRTSGVEAPIAVVPPALDLELPPSKRSWQAGRPFRFVTCGAAHFRKGFHLLIAAFLDAFPDVGEATLTIKTDPSCRWRSPRRDVIIRTDDLARPRLLGLYRAHDAYVTTSLGEGLGLPVAEAILAGLPVVGHRWGGHADLLTAGGYFDIPYTLTEQTFASDPSYYAPGQRCAFTHPKSVASALRRAVDSSPAERRRIANTARAWVLGRFGRAAAIGPLRRAWRQLLIDR